MPKSTQSNNSFSHMSKTERVNVSSVEQMQYQSDQYTRKYEHERRNLNTIEQAIRTVQEQIEKTKKNVTNLKRQCEEGEMKLAFTKMRNLQKQIDTYDKRYNDTLGEIDKVKLEINALRQERTLYRSNIVSVEEDIAKAEAELDDLMHGIEEEQNISKMSENKLLEMKLQNQKSKEEYYHTLNKLNQAIRDKKINMANKTKASEVKTVQNDTATILKKRLTKLIVNNKEKVRLIDNYQRNMKVIDEAFNTIKEATGLTDIQEIQNIFIKGEEQNYGLLTYVDVLNQEIDTLEDSNQNLRQKNETMKRDIAEKQRIFNGTPDDEKKRKKISELIDHKKVQVNQFEKMLQQIEPRMQQALLKLTKSKLYTGDPSLITEYETNGINLNQSSLDQYLADLEQYTNKIIFSKAKAANESPSQMLSKALLLDQLPSKDKRRVVDNQIAGNEDEGVVVRQLMDKTKLDEIANKQIEKYKSVPDRDKARMDKSKKP